MLLSFCYIILADLTPPTVTLRSFPHLVSNTTEWSFMYECADEPGCSFICSAHEMGQIPQFSPCGTSYNVDGLVNGREYEFEVVATDGVGNEGHIAYLWRIGECLYNIIIFFSTARMQMHALLCYLQNIAHDYGS